MRLGLGERKGDALILGERRAERLAFLHIAPGLVDRGLRRTEALQPDQRAAIVEARHDGPEGSVLFAHQAFSRHMDIIEENRATADRLGADVVKMGPLDPLFRQVNKESADATRPAFWIAGAGEDNCSVCLRSKAHGGLFAIQPPAIT